MKAKYDNSFLVRAIGYFEALANNLNYTETAAQIGISQPALTQQIKKLEENVGMPLFHMEGKRVRLTEAGEIFYNATKKVTEIYTDATNEIKQFSLNQHYVINIGIISAIPADVIIDFMIKFKQQEPNVDFHLKSIMRYGLRSQIDSDAIDVLVLYLPDDSFTGLTNYKTYRFCHNELLLASPFKLKEGNKITLKEAREYPWVGYPEEYYLNRLITSQCRKHNVLLPNYSGRFAQVENILNYSKRANTIATIPEVCLPLIKDEKYIYHFSPAIKFDVALVYRANKLKNPFFNKCFNAFDAYLNEKDFLTRQNELAKERN